MSEDEWNSLVNNDGDNEAIQEFESKIEKISTIIEYLDRYDTRKKGLFSSKRDISINDYSLVLKNQDKLLSVVEEINQYDRTMSDLKSEKNKYSNLILSLKPWVFLDIPLDLTSTKASTVLIGVVPEIADANKMKQEIADEVPECHFEVIGEDKDQSYLLIIYLTSKEEAVTKILKQYGFSKVTFKDLKGTAKHNISEASKRIDSIDKDIEDIQKKISDYVIYKNDLEVLYDHMVIERDRKKILNNLVKTKKIFMLEGWLPEKLSEEVKSYIEKCCDCYVDIIKPADDEEFPVLLANRDIGRSVESITNMYSVPNSREIDPNTVMAPFFILFFGLMLSDGGYGALLAIGSGIILKMFKLDESMKRFMKLMLYCGISTMLWGFLFGGWFGIPNIPALWFNPVDDPEMLLSFSLLFGVIHIFVALGMKAANLIREKKYLDVVFDVVFWYITFVGFILFLLPYVPKINTDEVSDLVNAGKYILLIGVVLLVLTQGRNSKNIFAKLIGGVGSLYDLIGFMSDVLSYSRLLALGLATSVIGSIVNQMALMLGFNNIFKIILIVAVLLAGHLINFAINALGAYVHSSRLQYIEFFGKFYKGGGTSFEPFKANTKYINLKH
ncbi:MAG TPA: V-type ATP synthase subunit I, partial [Acetivibrio sp.]|nr:V-type ATP synthase subunit I [Acetivibrio sp.]